MQSKKIRLLVLFFVLTGLAGYAYLNRAQIFGAYATIGKKPINIPEPAFSPPYQRESWWIIQAIMKDIYGLIAYRAGYERIDYSALSIKVVTHGESPETVFKVTAILPELDEAVELTIDLDGNNLHIWSPENYWGWTRTLIDLLLSDRQAAETDPEIYFPFYRNLLTPTSEVIAQENRSLSRILAKDILNANANDAAALLLGVLSLREAAGTFSDIRTNLNRMTAHLAISNAIRPMKRNDVIRAMAQIIQAVLINHQTAAIEKLTAFEALHRQSAYQAIHRAWCDALRTRVTADWRVLKAKPTLSLLEKIELFRAINQSISTEQAVAWVRSSEDHRIPFNDAARVVAESDYGVSIGHLFLKNSVAAEFQEIAFLVEDPAALVDKEGLVEFLNNELKTAVSGHRNGGLAVKVIPKGLWGGFCQRHLLHRMTSEYNFYRNVYGDRERADSFKGGVIQKFSSLSGFPIFSRILTPSASHTPTEQERLLAVLKNKPELLTRGCWSRMYNQDIAFQKRKIIGEIDAWFFPKIPPGTLYGLDLKVLERYFQNNSPKSREVVKDIVTRVPYDLDCISFYIYKVMAYRLQTDDLNALYGPLLEFNATVMRHMAAWYKSEEQPDKSIAIYERLCTLEPDNYFILGAYLVDLGRKVEAAQAYQKGWDLSGDSVSAANNSEWLVNHYYENGEKQKAMEIAGRAAKVYSYTGLWVMADLLEKMDNLEAAEEYYSKIRQRYEDPGVLVGFFRRHRDESNYKNKYDHLMAQLFPDAMVTVVLEDFTVPPKSGVKFRNTNRTMREFGLKTGDVIVAMDGIKIDNCDQYRAIVNDADNPEFSVIVWRNNSYERLKANLTRRYFNWQMENHSGA